MILKIHKSQGHYMVAACDKDLLGKKLDNNGVEFFVNPVFYEGDSCDEKRLVNELREATIANLLGDKTVSVALNHDFITNESIMYIDSVPHAQFIRI